MAEKAKTKMLVVSDPDNSLRQKVLALARQRDQDDPNNRHSISDVIRTIIHQAYQQLEDKKEQTTGQKKPSPLTNNEQLF